MSKIAFLGLGAMGSRMAPHLIKAGHDLTVWNRSPAAVAAAVARGARSAATPREAAEGAEFVFSMLTDDDASKAVWMTADTGALAGLGRGATAIEASTVSPEWLRSLAASVEAHGASLLDAPVVGSLPQAEAAQLVLLAGGAQEIFLKAKPVLGCFAGVVHHVGPQGQGATMKLVATALLAIQVAETLAALDKSPIAPKRALEIISGLPVMSPVGYGFAGLMVAGDFAPRFSAALIAKNLRCAAAEKAENTAKVPVLQAALRCAVEDAEKANQAKSTFLAMMCHELRTPLNAVIGFSEIMRSQMLGPISARYHEYAEDIHESGLHLLEVTNTILEML